MRPYPLGSPRLATRLGVAVLSLALVFPGTAHAEETKAPATGRADESGTKSTEKAVVVWSMLGTGVVSLGVSTFYFVKSSGASSDLRDEFRGRDCRTTTECERLREVAGDESAFLRAGLGFSVAAAGLLVGSFLVELLASDGKRSVVPTAAVSGNGGEVGLSGRF